MGDIEVIGNKVTKASLVKLGVDKRLEGYMIVCFWPDDEVTCGWNAGLATTDMLFGEAVLHKEIRNEIFQEDE